MHARSGPLFDVRFEPSAEESPRLAKSAKSAKSDKCRKLSRAYAAKRHAGSVLAEDARQLKGSRSILRRAHDPHVARDGQAQSSQPLHDVRQQIFPPLVEMVVHADPDDIFDQVDRCIFSGSDQKGVLTEIHEQIFGFHGPIPAEQLLYAAAD